MRRSYFRCIAGLLVLFAVLAVMLSAQSVRGADRAPAVASAASVKSASQHVNDVTPSMSVHGPADMVAVAITSVDTADYMSEADSLKVVQLPTRRLQPQLQRMPCEEPMRAVQYRPSTRFSAHG